MEKATHKEIEECEKKVIMAALLLHWVDKVSKKYSSSEYGNGNQSISKDHQRDTQYTQYIQSDNEV